MHPAAQFSRRIIFSVLCCATLVCAPASAIASRTIQVGVVDSTQTLYGDPSYSFPMLHRLHVQVLRINLTWGGREPVAVSRPTVATAPDDPAYDWKVYDRAVRYASQYGMKVLFAITGTPAWENGGLGRNHAPVRSADLRDFAVAAATRYSGTYIGPDGTALPPVRLWLAWNEPNNPVFLTPQFRRVGGRWVIQSARDYTRICNAVYDGVHSTELAGEKVGCGATAPRGNNAPATSRPSVSPLAFLRALHANGLRHFDAYDHHPYGRGEAPGTRPTGADEVTFGNIGVLVHELTRLFGPKRLWISEYGYETNPPDLAFGISLRRQADYLTQAFRIARRNPRIDLMIWFLLRDESKLTGWQSGLLTASGVRKPAFAAFAGLRH